jgi:hypothetical protein
LKVTDEKLQNPETNPNPDPLVRGTDPRIRIRIRTRRSRLRNTALKKKVLNLPYRVPVPIFLLFLDEDNYSVDTDEAFLVKPVQAARKVSAVRRTFCVGLGLVTLRCIAQYRYHKVYDVTVRDGTRRCRGAVLNCSVPPVPNKVKYRYLTLYSVSYKFCTLAIIFGTYYIIL